MELRRVKIDQIKVPEVRVTARFDPELWEQFQESMKQVGQISPIVCYEVKGELILVDGLHRLVESKNQGEEEIYVAVMPGDEVDVLTKNIFLDHLRGKTPVTDMIKVIRVLWKDYGLDSEKIAEKTGLTRDYVEKLQKISELTPMCLEALDEGRIGVGHAFALTKVKDPARQEMILGQQLLYNWKVKELEDYIKEVEAIVQAQAEAPAEERPREPIKLECFYCHGKFDPEQVANPTTCRECSSMMLLSIAEARRQVEQEQAPPEKGEAGP